jgi:hypothetical protein
MASGTKRYDDINKEITQLLEDPQSLSPLEQFKVVAWGMTGGLIKVETLIAAFDESERRLTSTAFKDRFMRAVDVSYLTPPIGNKKVQEKARSKVVDGFEACVAAFSAQLDEEARLKAQLEQFGSAQTEQSRQAQEALARKRTEIDEMARQAAFLDKDMAVAKPLNVVKKNTRHAALP